MIGLVLNHPGRKLASGDLEALAVASYAAVIGTCTADRVGALVLDTGFGRRLVTEPNGELLPRIC